MAVLSTTAEPSNHYLGNGNNQEKCKKETKNNAHRVNIYHRERTSELALNFSAYEQLAFCVDKSPVVPIWLLWCAQVCFIVFNKSLSMLRGFKPLCMLNKTARGISVNDW